MLRGNSTINRAARVLVVVVLIGVELALTVPSAVLALLRTLLREAQTGAEALAAYVEKLEIEARNMER